MLRNAPRWATVLWSGRSGDVTVMLQAAIQITCPDQSTTAWVGRSYILLRYLVFVFVVMAQNDHNMTGSENSESSSELTLKR